MSFRARHRLARLLISLALGGLCCVPIGCKSEPEPKSYDDCILRYVKAGMDRAAVSVVMDSCRKKFPAESTAHTTAAPQVRMLSVLELHALSGRAGLSYGNRYSGSIYNGNTTIAVREIEIALTTTVGGEQVTRVYRDQVSIGPQSTADFGFDIIVGDKGATYSWSISGAKGIPLGMSGTLVELNQQLDELIRDIGRSRRAEGGDK